MINLALVNGRPRVLTLKEMLYYYLEHQKDVVTRKCRFELAKAEERAHILEGFKIALDNLDAVIHTIRDSANADIAKAALMEKFKLSDRQSQAILDLRLQRLTGLERQKIDDEYIDVLGTIDYLKGVLADGHKVLEIIKADQLEKAKKFGDERRTEISADVKDMQEIDLIANEDIVITISNHGYIKRQTTVNFKAQRRGGVGKMGGGGKKEDDFTEHMFLATTHDYVLFFTNKGRAYQLRGYEIPEAGRTAKGTAIINLLPFAPGERITAVINGSTFGAARYLFMATNHGSVKKTRVEDFASVRKNGLMAINLNDGEELISVRLTDGQAHIFMATRKGIAILFKEEDVRCMGRQAHGVKGIKLRPGDLVVAMDTVTSEAAEVLTVSEKGFGKRSSIKLYNPQTRGGMGHINYKIADKTGNVAGMTMVHPGEDLYLITVKGIIIHMLVNDIRETGRSTSGVIMVTLNDGDLVSAIASVAPEDTVAAQRQEEYQTEVKAAVQAEAAAPQNETPADVQQLADRAEEAAAEEKAAAAKANPAEEPKK